MRGYRTVNDFVKVPVFTCASRLGSFGSQGVARHGCVSIDVSINVFLRNLFVRSPLVLTFCFVLFTKQLK